MNFLIKVAPKGDVKLLIHSFAQCIYYAADKKWRQPKNVTKYVAKMLVQAANTAIVPSRGE